MGFFRRRGAPEPEPLGSRLERSAEVALHGAPVPARPAVAAARPLAVEVDPRSTLSMVVGHDITPDGRSHHWEVFFDARGILAGIVVSIELPDEGQATATVVANPKLPDREGSFMRELWAGLDAAGRRLYLDGWFADEPLPEDRLDSQAAMRLFEDEGFDLVSGPTDVVLSANTTEDGPVWVLQVGRDQATRPLR